MRNTQNTAYQVVDASARIPEVQTVTAQSREDAIKRSKKLGWKNPVILKEDDPTFELDASSKVDRVEKVNSYVPKSYRI